MTGFIARSLPALARAVLSLILLAVPGLLAAHELWIAPEDYQIEPGAPILAALRNGELFEGIERAHFDRSTRTLIVLRPGAAMQPLAPRNGDRPAIALPGGAGPGLVIVAFESTPSALTYRAWEKFQKFAQHKDFPDIAARHDARGLPRTDFREDYTRHAKALIAVGAGAGADQRLGLETEFVAEANPYAGAGTGNGTLPVRLYYQGKVRGDAQVEIFERAPDGSVRVSLTRTDAFGKAEIPVKPGYEYLLDAVVLRPAPAGSVAAWETLWAALTFAVPAR